MADAPDEIRELAERFERGRTAYRAAAYNETQVRREFIDPMFTALGWDVANAGGYADAYKEVIHEDRLRIEGAMKAPDYAFRIGGVRKFLVEAKKPSVNLHDHPAPAYQLRRYAWNGKLPLSVLTDFDELVVYDCRHRPEQTDKASAHRLLYVRSDEYLTRWSEIADIFHKQSVLNGSFDAYANATKAHRGTSEVDSVFLAEMEDWRRSLAKDLTQANSLSQPELNFAVQQIIDRIVFLRICEDRGIEPYGDLDLAADSPNVYAELVRAFRRADDRYNSGLFHFHHEVGQAESPDLLTPGLVIGNSVLKRIIKRLYYPESPFDFRVLPLDILGQVYERFLGQIIRLAPGGDAVVETKPEVRKAGGVYYTPTYVVEHIVDRTLGPALETLNPVSASKLRVLDPASGSGSFLLVAFDRLLKWHLDQYVKSKSSVYHSRIYQGANGDFYLTVEEKRRILLNNIFGVDLDAQAVEVTKLSLLLRVLEDESAETLAEQLKLFNERALPNLHQNVKCGNSLIGPDYFDTNGMLVIDFEDRTRINAFDWNREFPEVMSSGGFDVVIGNPPYVFTREQFTDEERAYYGAHYPCGWEKRNTFLLFMELLPRLLKSSGKGGYIVPNSWLTIESASLVRSLYRDRIREVFDLNYAVFDEAVVEPCIFIIDGNDVRADPLVLRANSAHELASGIPIAIDRSLWDKAHGRILVPDDASEIALVDAIFSSSMPIGDAFDVQTGLQAYEKGKGHPRQTAQDVRDHVFDREAYEDEDSYRYLQGRDVLRFGLNWSGTWMQYGPWLSQPREISMFTRPRVLIREITSPMPHCFSAVFTEEPFLSNKSVLTVLRQDNDTNQLRLLEAVLNSRLMSLCYRARAVKSARKVFPKVVIKNLRELPFPVVSDTAKVAKLLALASAINATRADVLTTRVPQQAQAASREAERLEAIFERSVCALFGLSKNETEALLDLTSRTA